jgi:AcrR family transcriptional regulator
MAIETAGSTRRSSWRQPSTGRRVRQPDPLVTDSLLAAAIAVVAENGFGGFTMDAVAARAGCGKPAAYRRWASKEALLEDAVLLATGRAVRTPDTGSAREDLIIVLEELVAWLSSPEGSVWKAVIAEAERDKTWAPAVTRIQEGRRSTSRVIVERGVERGELPAGTDPEWVLDIAVAPIWLHALVWRRDVVADWTYLERLVDSALAATS